MTGDQGRRDGPATGSGRSGGSWTPWAPRHSPDGRHPVAARAATSPAAPARSSAEPPAPWPPAVVPNEPIGPAAAQRRGLAADGRAPVVDDRRVPGAPPVPPTAWPAPLLDGPAPGGARPPARTRALVAFVAFLVGALVVGAAFATYAFGDRRGRSDRPSARAAATTVPRAGSIPTLDIRRILEVAQPSVVTIQTGSENSIFGGAGSGVVISADGLILTNAHVIEGAAGVIQVRFNDGTTAPAELVGASTAHDIALVKVDRTGLTPAKLGSSANLRVGDDVVAIGNALNLGGDPSVTRGIVSAKDRSIADGKISLDHLIQTDAAINPGNSGGPLIDASGQVVGINTAIIDGAQNVGFSIAIDSVEELIPQLKAGKGDLTPKTAVLGVRSVTVDDNLDEATRQQYGVVATSGALIAAVDVDSPAADGGLEEGDVVVEVDGSAVATNSDLTEAVRARSPGDKVTITVERHGRRQSFDVTLGP